MNSINLNALMNDPEKYFADPKVLLENQKLTKKQKITLLQKWELDARSLQVATEEGMSGGESDLLRQVKLALESIEGMSEGDPSPSK